MKSRDDRTGTCRKIPRQKNGGLIAPRRSHFEMGTAGISSIKHFLPSEIFFPPGTFPDPIPIALNPLFSREQSGFKPNDWL
jgi:hypothetical protein